MLSDHERQVMRRIEFEFAHPPGRFRSIIEAGRLVVVGAAMVALVVLAALDAGARMFCVIALAVLGMTGGYLASGSLRWRMIGPRVRASVRPAGDQRRPSRPIEE